MNKHYTIAPPRQHGYMYTTLADDSTSNQAVSCTEQLETPPSTFHVWKRCHGRRMRNGAGRRASDIDAVQPWICKKTLVNGRAVSMETNTTGGSAELPSWVRSHWSWSLCAQLVNVTPHRHLAAVSLPQRHSLQPGARAPNKLWNKLHRRLAYILVDVPTAAWILQHHDKATQHWHTWQLPHCACLCAKLHPRLAKHPGRVSPVRNLRRSKAVPRVIDAETSCADHAAGEPRVSAVVGRLGVGKARPFTGCDGVYCMDRRMHVVGSAGGDLAQALVTTRCAMEPARSRAAESDLAQYLGWLRSKADLAVWKHVVKDHDVEKLVYVLVVYIDRSVPAYLARCVRNSKVISGIEDGYC
ncbi:hypothetical protein SVAN01_03926 [Stagonosporopsis vannaccii]|nr:hypothetical protein SVAN01_03926 [Stagonosporopsis vannaccii]